MLHNSLLIDMACRASNLSERTLIVKNLVARNAREACTTPLSPLDTWNINKLAGKLAVQPVKESYEEGSVNTSILEDIKKLLIDYKLYEINLANLSEADKLEFKKIHIHWLKIYQEALETINLPQEKFSVSRWYEPEIYYGNFAKVCEPFLRLLQNRLQPVCDAINVSADNYRIAPQVLTDIQLHLLNRFEMCLTWALEADINVYCSKNKIAKSTNDTDAYVAYLEQAFDNQQDYHSFYCKFPVLGRWLAQVTDFLCTIGEQLIQRLTSDRDEISRTFFNGRQISQIKSFKLGKSDCHAGGKTVVIVELELDNSEPATIVYKPRCIQSEAALQGLLENLTRDKVIEFASYQVLCKDGYGYAEFLPSGRNHVQSEQESEKFYRQLGGYLAIFYILGGGDLHQENILVVDGNAFICDCETVLEVVPQNRDQLSDTVFDSVFKTAMLEWPRANTGDASNQMKIGGYSGGESYELPYAVPRINDRRMSLAQAVEYQTDVRVEVEATNRIYYKGQLVNPQDYKNCIVDGFNRVYSWFQENQTEAITQIEDLFTSSSVRFINWGTEAYTKLIISVRHPKCLAEPLEVDLLFNSLMEHRRQWDKQGQLAELELAAMWQLDVPIFTARAGSNELVYNYQRSLPDILEISPLDNAIERIQKLSTENRIRQNQYIYASLSTDEINSPYFIASAVNYAQQIGWQLCELLQPPSSKAPWKTYEYTGLGKRFVDIRGDLYEGSAGICLFFAYLDAIEPQPEFRQVAERALAYSIEQRNNQMIGAYQGATGLIYLLIHLAQLWNKPELLDLAVNLSDELIPRISQDLYFDVLQGVAGIIPVMLSLAEATSGKGIDCAHLCAQHLLQHATSDNNTLSWPHHPPELVQGNLTGFSHGAGGIGWALISLGCYTNQSEYIAAGRQAFAYETTKFDSDERDWYDLRTSVMTVNTNEPHFANAWCNGAAGIGLSRISSWAVLGKTDDDMLRDAYRALNATLRNFDKVGNDSLCHGKTGNAEVFLRFAKLRDEPYLQMEANGQAQAQWRNFEKARRWICGSGGTDVYPGLMLGLAGIGMHFLRLAYPDRIPSPLLLDPPPKYRMSK
ncbi:MAG: type 2 lantipeptide synthetase LanM [Oscillatoriales cyanobacterium]|nr:MAG: type 2 lantipeptide synthetase LanM [Oscillatoriales cyanobacterium]TAH22934.1 MAG: type 2 lantipeptide synthetase LanM [Oscillatoriales cyanobacterium]